jgi:F0F1-type ATP synthase membrane subunit c/vacuolar-type H+-ATPase subunit K
MRNMRKELFGDMTVGEILAETMGAIVCFVLVYVLVVLILNL